MFYIGCVRNSLVLHFCTIIYVSAIIYQQHQVGDHPLVQFSTQLSAGEMECTTFAARGNLSVVVAEVLFTPSVHDVLSTPNDLLIALEMHDSEWNLQECVQIGGYNIYDNQCKYYSHWNEPTWENNVAGFYNSTVLFHYNMQLFEARGRTSGWRICAGNGWRGSIDKTNYTGQLFLYGDGYVVDENPGSIAPSAAPTPSPTSTYAPSKSPTRAPSRAPTVAPAITPSPTPSQYFQLAPSTSCGASVLLHLDLSLSGYELRCVSVVATGALNTAAVNMTFARNTAGLESPSDAGLIISNTGTGRGVQIGGYSYVDDTVAGNRADWPKSWSSLSSSSNIASVNVSTFGVGSSADYYRVCVVNGYKQAGLVRYSGIVSLTGLQVDCTLPSPIPIRQPTTHPTTSSTFHLTDLSELGESAALSFDGTARGGNMQCLQIASAGIWTGLILSLNFQGDGITWASDLLVSITSGGDCTHIGGSAVDLALPACDFIAYWPSSMNRISSGDYSAALEWPQMSSDTGDFMMREICVGHGYSQSAACEYQGTLEFSGLVHALPPTPVPRSNDRLASDKTDTIGLLTTVIIGFTVVICVIVVITVYCRRRTAHMYKRAEVDFEEDEPDSNVAMTFNHRNVEPQLDNAGRLVLSRYSISNLAREKAQDKALEMHIAGSLPPTCRHDVFSPCAYIDVAEAGPSNSSNYVTGRITHNAKKLFQRPKSLASFSSPQSLVGAGVPALGTLSGQPGVDSPVVTKKERWFGHDPFSGMFDNGDSEVIHGHPGDDDSDIETSVHFRKVVRSQRSHPEGSFDDWERQSVATMQRTRTSSEEENDEFMRRLAAEFEDKNARPLSADLKSEGSDDSSLQSRVTKTGSEDSVGTMSTTESAKDAVFFVNSTLLRSHSK